MVEPPDLDLLKGAFQMARVGLSLVRDTKDLVSAGPVREKANTKIAEAERTFNLAEVQIARALNYQICQCTFPPQIMLSQGRHHKYNAEVFVCPECQRQEPSQKHFEWLDENERRRPIDGNPGSPAS